MGSVRNPDICIYIYIPPKTVIYHWLQKGKKTDHLKKKKKQSKSKFLSRFQDFEPLQLGRSFQLSYVDTSCRQDENLPG